MEDFKEYEQPEENLNHSEIGDELEEVLENLIKENPETLSSEVIEKIKEAAFTIIIDKHLTGVFVDSLYDADYIENEEEESEFISGMIGLTREEQLAALSTPQEIRKTQLIALREQGVPIEEIPQKLFEQASGNGYTVGFHVSPHEIRPDTHEEDSPWVIKGTEFDDRDDRPMAYYSLDHQNLYRKKRGNYIYMVRAQTGEDTDHKTDSSNNWGRAPSLSVISQMENLSEIEKRIDEAIEKLKTDRS